MKKRLFVVLLTLALTLPLAGCGCDHEWYAATCAAPKHCSLCDITEGEALPHTWQDATCTAPKTCSVCKTTEGEPVPHAWQEASCTVPQTCSVCKETNGEPAAHTWQKATCIAPKTCSVCRTIEGKLEPHTWKEATCTAPKTCSVCKETDGEPIAHTWLKATTEAPRTCSLCKSTEGNKLQTDPRFTTASTEHLHGTWVCDVLLTDEGILEMYYPLIGSFSIRLRLQFGITGEFILTGDYKDKADFLARLRRNTIDSLYASFAEDGLTPTQADQWMTDTYGMGVEAYVNAVYTSSMADIILAGTINSFEEVYYIENGALYTAPNWYSDFTRIEYTLNNGILVIDDISLQEGYPPLSWTREQ